MTTRAEVVACARTWLGTPFHHQACVKQVGVDCAHLIIGVGRDLGLFALDFDVPAYPRQPDGVTMLALCDKYMDRIGRMDMTPGDVLVIHFGKNPQHMAFVADSKIHKGQSVIHSLDQPGNSRGGVVEAVLEKYMMRRFVRAYRLRGVE